MSSSTIKVIVSFDNQKKPTEFNFISEKMDCQNLVTFIQCTSSLDPVVLYYYNMSEKRFESLENQEQLDKLLASADHPVTLRLYCNKDQIRESAMTDDAWNRLGTLVTQHKQIVESSCCLTRWIGMLASMIAVAENSETFQHEFEMFEEMIEKKSSRTHRGTEKTDENEDELIGNDFRQQSFFGREDPYFDGFDSGHRRGAFGMNHPFHHVGGRGGNTFKGHRAHHFRGIRRHGPFRGHQSWGMYFPFEMFEGERSYRCNFFAGRGRSDYFDTHDRKFKFGHHHFGGKTVYSSSKPGGKFCGR